MIKRLMLKAGLFFIASLMICSNAKSQLRPTDSLIKQIKISAYSPLIERFQSLIRQEMKLNNYMGVSAALIVDDSVIWKEAFGYADRENKIPMTTSTNLCIGSLTKPFTALGIMQLQDRGMINIDKPLNKYLPQFTIKMRKGHINDITARMLLTHHSGIQTDEDFGMTTENESYTDVVNYLKTTYSAYPSNLLFCYSNVAFSVLGNTIQQLSKKSYPEYIYYNILKPLGMNNSGFLGYQKLTELSNSYENDGRLVLAPYFRDIPAGGIYSNIDDLAKFAKELIAVYKGRKSKIISTSTLKETFNTNNNIVPLDFIKRGLPWMIFENDSSMVAWHGGSTRIANSGFVIAPKKGVAAIFQINTAGGFDLANKGFLLFEKELGVNLWDGKYDYSKTANLGSADTMLLSQNELQKFVGDYAQLHSVFSIKFDGNNLIAYRTFNNYILKALSKDEFIPFKITSDSLQAMSNQRYIFKDINGYQVLIQKINEFGEYALCNKVREQNINEVWKNRIGKYKIVNYTMKGNDIYSEVELYVYQNKFLMLKLLSDPIYEYPLLIESDNEAVIGGLETYGGSTIEFKKEKNSEVLIYSGLQMRKMK